MTLKNSIFGDTEEFDQKFTTTIKQIIDDVLIPIGINTIPVGSAFSPTPGILSGDLDLQVEIQDVINSLIAATNNRRTDELLARQTLKTYLSVAGFETYASGINVFVKVPFNGKFHQVDLEVINYADHISKYHQHIRPKNSPYKGVCKQLMISAIAKSKRLFYSPWEGLYTRTDTNAKGTLITRDWDSIAYHVLGDGATGTNLNSVESILEYLPKETSESLLLTLQEDKNWLELK